MRRLLRFVKFFWSIINVAIFFVFCIIFLHFVSPNGTTNSGCKHNVHKNHNILYRYQVYSHSSDVKVSNEPFNWIPITFLAEPNVCKNAYGTLKYLFVVHSNEADISERQFLRHEIFNPKNSLQYQFRPIFVVGVPKNNSNLTNLLTEATTFHDLLIVNITENYHNITHKARAWISWLNDKCSHLNYTHVIKIDDDVMLNLDSLMEMLEEFKNHRKMVLCRILPDGVVVRNNESKWYLSNDEYAPTNLGLYCQGLAYIISMPLLEIMHKNLQRVQYLWMDDWYVTHALLYNSNAIYVDISPHVFPIESVGQIHAILKYSSFNKKNYRPIFGHFRPKTKFKLEDRVQNWKKIVRQYDCV